MVRKRKASPKASLHHEQRRIKRREMAPFERYSKAQLPQGPTLPLSQPLTASTLSTSATSPKAIIPEQPNKSPDPLLCPVELLHGPRTVAKATQIFDHLTAYYQRQIVTTAKAQASDIFRDLHTLKLCITQLFSDSIELEIPIEQLLGKEKLRAYRAWVHRFEAVWAGPAISAMQQRFRDMRNLIDSQPLGRTELNCFEFAKDLESLAMKWDCSKHASITDWNHLVPRLVSPASATRAADHFEQEYLTFQNNAYAGAEVTRLWLLVWRTLKVVRFPLAKEPDEVLLPGERSEISKIDAFAIERTFFGCAENPSSNQASLANFVKTGDANNPQWIEGFVSKYCSHVAKCHDEKEKYYWQFSTMGPDPVPKIVVSTLQASNEQAIAHPEWNVLLHRVVLRLNYLLGGHKILKRWWYDKETHSLAYLDVQKCSTDILERAQCHSIGGALATTAGRRTKGNGNDTLDQSSGCPIPRSPNSSVLGNAPYEAAGNGDKDGENPGDDNGGDRKNQGRTGESSTSSGSSSSANNDDQENKTPFVGKLPLTTKAQLDAFARNVTSTESPQIPQWGPGYDKATAVDVRSIRDHFTTAVPGKSVGSSVSPENSSNQENVVPPVDAGRLSTRITPNAFPWVNYPLGERRPSERAMGMQFAREIRERGVMTPGSHVEDVENIVPQPLCLSRNGKDEDTNQAGSSAQGIVRRALGALGRFMARPIPSARPEPLPSLPPHGSPRKPATRSPLAANRDGASGIRRARDRAPRIPGLRLNQPPRWDRLFGRPDHSLEPVISPLAAQRSWVHNTNENMPWTSPNQASSPQPSSCQMPSARIGERRLWSPIPLAMPIDISRGPPRHLDGTYFDRNTIKIPTSPTPLSGRGQRTRVTNHTTTATTIQGSLKQSTSPPALIGHAGGGPNSGARADSNGLTTDLPAWQWIPQDHGQHRVFMEDGRARVSRGDTARRIAHRLYNQLVDQNAGEAVMTELCQLLRSRYEWGLTRNYRFQQRIPTYYRPPVPVTTPPLQKYRPYYGGPGTVPGYLNFGQLDDNLGLGTQPESDEVYRGRSVSAQDSPFYVDSRPDPKLLNRAKRLQSWDSWHGGANRGNQDFDLYVSPGNGSDQSRSVGQPPQSSINAHRGGLVEKICGRNQPGSDDSVSTLALPSPQDQGQCPPTQRRIFPGSSSGPGQETSTSNGPPLGAPCPTSPAGPRNTGWGCQTSGGSSLSGRGSQSTLQWPSCPHDGSQLASSGPQVSSSSASQTSDSSNSQGTSSYATQLHAWGSRASANQTTDNQFGNRTTPSREQYMQMTAQQLRAEIIARGGGQRNLRQRKDNLTQELLDYDRDGIYGNGAQPRRRAPAVAPHPTLSPRALRPRDNGKTVRR